MNITPTMISSEEQELLHQTIEMFEVIVQANPQDFQSMEILKDAYFKLARESDGMAVSRKIADSYYTTGQYSQAMIEYESLLQRDPNNVEIIAALGEVEERLQKDGSRAAAQIPTPSEAAKSEALNIDLDFRVHIGETGTLIRTEQTQMASNGAVAGEAQGISFSDDGNEALSKFLIQHRIANEEIVASALERVTKKNFDRAPGTVGISLIGEISRRGAVDMETLLSSIIDRSKFAYVPLEYYDVDRAVVKMLPEELTLGRMIVPFDVMSRTLMIAMANPFDAAGKEAVQKLLDYNLQWHLASPEAITKVLGETYRLGSSVNSASSFRLAD